MHCRSKQRGFTLLEIMVVLVILGILAAVVVSNIGGEPDRARIVKVKQDIGTMESALESYKLDNFRLPTTEQGLKALTRKPEGEPEPRNYRQGGYIKRLEKDPWGNPYQYTAPGEHGEFDLYSFGADGQSGGEGVNADVGNWNADDEKN